MKITGLLFWLNLFPFFCFSQEVLFEENLELPNIIHYEPLKNLQRKNQSLNLPFFDDFFQYEFNLKSNLWEEDENLLVGFGIGKNPPNRGVAIIDGAKKNGQGYFETPAQGTKERLLSQSINLSNFNPSDSIYFSFAFMHGGFGDKAEINDTLKLYFIDNNQISNLVWFRVGGDTMTAFKKVILPVTDPKYLHGQFQFYFETYGNLNGLFDQWLLDYIFLNQNRNANDTLFTDLSFSDKRFSIFDSLTSVPLKQFQSKNWMSQDFIEVTNLSANNEGRNLIWSISEVKNSTILNPPLVQNQFFAFFPPYTNYPIPSFADQSNVIEDFSRLRVQFSLNLNASDPQVNNDTLNLFFPIDSVWAYDDGEPQTGYGLRTAKTFLQKFYSHNQDSLKAVMINFVPNIDIPNGKGFRLVILSHLHRDSVLYSKFYNLTHYQSLDSFNYFLLDSILPLPEIYYIGITQPDNKPIGVGFDFSYNNNRNVFWDSSSVFVPSRLNGTLMIRPVMGSKPELAVSKKTTQINKISLFPNPFHQFLFLETTENIDKLELYDCLGNFVQAIKLDKIINLEEIPSGLYFIKIKSEEQIWIKKIIKLP